MDSQALLSTLPTDVLKSLFYRTFEGITISENGVILYANAEFAAMLGRTPQEVMGQESHKLAMPGADAQAVQGSMKSNGERTCVIRGIHKSGQVVHAEIRSLPYYWSGRHLRLTAFKDITGTVEAASNLPACEQPFRMLVESAEQGIWQIDAELNTVFVNAKMAGFLRYTPEEMIGRALHSFVPPHLHDMMRANIASRRAGNRAVIESRYLRKDGSIAWMTNAVAPILSPDGTFLGALGFLTDISAQKEAEEKLAALRGQMLFSTQTSLLSEIANGIAHEINNPLLVIRSYTDVLREGVEKGLSREELLEPLKHIDSTVSRITQIVQSLAVHTRTSNPVPFTKVRLGRLVGDTIDLCDTQFVRAGINLIRQPIAEELELECRSVPVSQILLNLLNNAADAVENSQDKWVRVGAESRESEILIWVEDSGPGVPVAERGQIMQAFFTTKPPHRGTGLGLSISRKIAEGHGGSLQLDVDSACTRFLLRLPKTQVSRVDGRSIGASITPVCLTALACDQKMLSLLF